MPLIEPPCLHKGCYEDSLEGSAYCGPHRPKQWRGNSRAKRLPAGWASMRHQVLKRDKYVCHLCGKPGADSVDHVIAGDDHSRDNLRAVHDASFPHCHKKKTAMEAVQARKLRDPDASVIARARMKGLL